MSRKQRVYNSQADHLVDLENRLDAALAENWSLTQRIIDLEQEVATLRAPKPQVRFDNMETDNEKA